MKSFYLLVILIGSTHGKIVIHDDDVHITNEINKDDSTPNVTASNAALPSEATIAHNKLEGSTEEHADASSDDLVIATTSAVIKSPAEETHVNEVGNDHLIIISEEINITDEITTTTLVSKIDTNDATETSLAHNTVEDNIDEHVNVSNDDLVISSSTTPTRTTTKPPDQETYIKGLDNDFLRIISEDTNTTEETTPVMPPVSIKVDNGTALLLTPFIKEGRIAEARNACRVDPDMFLGFESYSGFLTVDETMKSHLFFWYFPVQQQSVNETPWIVWLQGGPGASSMTGLFDEIGPVNVSPFGTLKKNRHSWIQDHSLLFIDNPVGTGYSFTESNNGFAKNLETYATHLHTAVKQFVQIFPELQVAPLFIAGESYAGKYVPALASKIHRHRDRPGPHFNLQGVMLGNALVDPDVISNVADPFQYFGLMDETQLSLITPLVEGFQDDITNNRSAEAKSKWISLIGSLLFLSSQKHAYNFLRDDLNVGKYVKYLDRPEVKRALHVGDIKFSYLNVTVNLELAPDFLSNTTPLMEELLDHYRVLVYCGQLDQMLPCLYTSKNYRTWKWNGTQEFLQAVRYPYIFNSRNAGYHKTGGRLSEVVFRGAGHMVPLDSPAPAQALVARFTRGEPLGPRSPKYERRLIDIQAYLKRSNITNKDNVVINF